MLDKGNNYSFDKEIFQKGEKKKLTIRIKCEICLWLGQQVMKEEIGDYLKTANPKSVGPTFGRNANRNNDNRKKNAP
jgi:hypothetical protein